MRTITIAAAVTLLGFTTSAQAQEQRLGAGRPSLDLSVFGVALATQTDAYGPSADRRRELELEISDLRQQEAEISNAGPVLMMIVGYVLAPLVLIGPVVLIAAANCDSSFDDCGSASTAGLIMTGLGVAGASLGIAGLVMAINNGNRRNLIRGTIRDRKDALEALSLGVRLHTQGGSLALRGAF